MKKPGAVSPETIFGPLFAICQEPAAPEERVPSILFRSSPFASPYRMASATPEMAPASAIWLAILVCWPLPAGPSCTMVLPISWNSGRAAW